MIRRRSRRPPRRSVLVVAAVAAAVFAGAAWATVFSNPAAITINDSVSPPTIASPYPSDIVASGLTGGLTAITATITNFSHVTTNDVDILLAGPTGKTVILMSDVGGFTTTTNKTITFDDTAANSLPGTALSSGTFMPTNLGPNQCNGSPDGDAWPSPAPAGPYGSTMSALFAAPVPLANGTYSLYVVDDCFGDTGSISGGWSINITGGGPTAVALRSFGALPSRNSVVLHWRTASEATLLGFNVYRVDGKRSFRINRALIPAKAAATVADGSYRLVDRSIRPGRQYTYRLQSVELSGTRTWIGTAAVRIAD